MRQLFASAWVIARRDYVATVFSRIFILFLLTPLLSVGAGGVMGLLAHDNDGAPPRPVVALLTSPADSQALQAARARLAVRLGDDGLPDLAPQPASPHSATSQPAAAQPAEQRAHALLLQHGEGRGHGYAAVLMGGLDRPALLLSSAAPGGLGDDVGLLIDTARSDVALGGAPPMPVSVGDRKVAAPRAFTAQDRTRVARGAQTAVFFLLVLLSGMSLSTFVEEKSNKVIEVLAAAVPVDAIFLGKLAAMLAISITGIVIWVGAAAIGVFALAPHILAQIAAPALGWPLFGALTVLYFIVSYLLLGAIFLGLGSQASSPREVQSLAMPVTMLQLVLFAFVTAGVAKPDAAIGIASAIFPWSSPLAMLGRAAIQPLLWPHLLALAWQMGWLVIAMRLAAARFRTSVLKSGGGRGLWRLRRR